ncbi:MAG: hypothetical protein ACYTG5_10705 [Planctomycetota bacterium]|jgi:hypothetical protein
MRRDPLHRSTAEWRTEFGNLTGSANGSIDLPDNPILVGWVLSNGLQPRMTK